MNFAEEVGTEIAIANIVPKGLDENENHSHRVGQKKSPPKRAKSPKRGGRSITYGVILGRDMPTP